MTMQDSVKRTGRKTVYCTGPFYSAEERQLLGETVVLLHSLGFDTCCPSTDGLETACGSPLPGMKNAAGLMARAAFALNLHCCIELCDACLFLMNGRVPDEGGVVTAAIAFACGKPVVIYKRDHRTVFHGWDNSMITGLAFSGRTVLRPDGIGKALTRAMKEDRSSGPAGISASLEENLILGRKIRALCDGEIRSGTVSAGTWKKIASLPGLRAGRGSRV